MATLDTDGGLFQVMVSRVIPLLEYKNPIQSMPEVRTGRVLLYEDGKLILEVEQEFSLIETAVPSRPPQNEEEQGFFDSRKRLFLSREGVSAKAGSIYRLEVAIDGYDPISSVATMPHAPVVKSIKYDTLNMSSKYNVFTNFHFVSTSFAVFMGNRLWYPLHIEIEDFLASSGYYTIQAIEKQHDCDIITKEALLIGSSDWSILYDNPHMVAGENLLDDSGAYDIFAFAPFFFSNRTFANSARNIIFYIPFSRFEVTQGMQSSQYILLKQITKEAWEYNRAFVLNSNGLDFFNSEPVTIPSNIQNGFGCFSLTNTVKFRVLEYYF